MTLGRSTPRYCTLASAVVWVTACASDGGADSGVTPEDAGRDAVADIGTDAPSDSGPDSAAMDASADASDTGAGADGGPDGGAFALEYQACDGNTFYPAACGGESCVEAGLERRVYDIWRARFMAIHGLSAAEMDSRIVISDVSVADGPVYVWWRIDYVFVLGWARSRQSESVNLGDYPLAAPPADADITRGVDLAIESAEQFDIASVKSFAEVRAAADACATDLVFDYCNVKFINVSGELTVRGNKPLGDGNCIQATVDVEAGAVLTCITQACEMT